MTTLLGGGRTRIGSSQIAALLIDPETGRSIHPYLSELDLFREKVGLVEPRESTPAQKWGKQVEQSILAAHAQEQGRALWEPGTLLSRTHDIASATPDAFLVEEPGLRVVEAKNVGEWMQAPWGAGETDEDAPLHYVAQVTWEIGVAREAGIDAEIASVGHLVASIAGAPPRLFRIPFDLATYEALLERAEAFFRDHVRTGREPDGWEADGHALAYTKARWKKSNGRLLDPTPEAVTIHGELVRAKVAYETAKAAKKQWTAKMQSLIGDADGIRGLATWKSTNPKLVAFCDWEAVARDWALHLQAEHPDLVEPLRAIQQQHVLMRPKQKSHRTLLVKGMPKSVATDSDDAEEE